MKINGQLKLKRGQNSAQSFNLNIDGHRNKFKTNI